MFHSNLLRTILRALKIFNNSLISSLHVPAYAREWTFGSYLADSWSLAQSACRKRLRCLVGEQ